MKVFLCANNSVGLDVCRFLIEQGEEIVGLGIHDPATQKYTEEIIQVSKLPKERIFLASTLHHPNVIDTVKAFNAEMGIAAFWDTLLKPNFFNLFPRGCINFHGSYLPYNRGKNPNVWPIIEGTPAGVSLHYIDEGIDTGDLIARREIPVELTDTGGTLYEKTLFEITELFKETWPALKKGTHKQIRQNNKDATFHFGKEVDKLDQIDLDKLYKGGEIINRIRSRSYSNRSFAYFIKDGKKIYLNLSLSKSPDNNDQN